MHTHSQKDIVQLTEDKLKLNTKYGQRAQGRDRMNSNKKQWEKWKTNNDRNSNT